jgi:hypothetical protein
MSKVIQVRDVPDAVHADLVRLAAREGLSLSQFLAREYERISARARNQDIFSRATGQPGPRLSTSDIVEDLRALREGADDTGR